MTVDNGVLAGEVFIALKIKEETAIKVWGTVDKSVQIIIVVIGLNERIVNNCVLGVEPAANIRALVHKSIEINIHGKSLCRRAALSAASLLGVVGGFVIFNIFKAYIVIQVFGFFVSVKSAVNFIR